MTHRWLILLFALLSGFLTSCQAKTPYPQEVGPAAFLRDYDQALALSKKTGKPIFAFFQEVPG